VNKAESRIIGSALWAAYGDALGFVSELVDRKGLMQRTGGMTEIQDTIQWSYQVGGKYGVRVLMPPGMYSDDTQLRLATCRAIGSRATFDIDAFSKVELPIFPAYGLGAGVGTKASATNLARDNVQWFANFHGNYTNGGGNGAAMRIQPHVWALPQPADRDALALAIVRNSVCTHGHPRAIVGALLHAFILHRTLLTDSVLRPVEWAEELQALRRVPTRMLQDDYLGKMWLPEWERRMSEPFAHAFQRTVDECLAMISAYQQQTLGPEIDRYEAFVSRIEARDKLSRGSGTKSAILSAALADIFREKGPEAAVRCSANVLGSDTDTIGTMAGAVLGAVMPAPPKGDLIDLAYIAVEAKRMYAVAAGKDIPTFSYPSLLEWKPPRSGVEALGTHGDGFAIAGLGPVTVKSEAFSTKDATWRWAVTQFGQTMLVKSKLDVEPLSPTQVSPPRKGNLTHAVSSPPAPTRDKRPPQRESTEQQPLFGGRQPHLDAERERQPNLGERGHHPNLDAEIPVDDYVFRAERDGFHPEVLGEIFHQIARGPSPVHRASVFAAAVMTKMSRRK
jgi:ADP-ribosylglycohydrolase